MTQTENAQIFHDLHQQTTPLILYNIWDAATAKAVCEQGAKAVATGSWSVAAAHSYADGQNIPLDLVAQIVTRIVETVDVPVSVDFECGYADTLGALADNFQKIIDTGAVGINFEDQITGEKGLRSADEQARRLEVLANAVSKSGVKMFMNARTDLFLQEQDTSLYESLLVDAIKRESLYAQAGATGFFVPGLSDRTFITRLCENVSLPVNIMASSTNEDAESLKNLGVSRISFGPHPFLSHIKTFKQAAEVATLEV